MIWQIAAAVIIGGVCLGLLGGGIIALIETLQHPDDAAGSTKLGIALIIVGLLVAAFTLAMAFGNL